jgi:protein-tyrosine kinase
VNIIEQAARRLEQLRRAGVDPAPRKIDPLQPAGPPAGAATDSCSLSFSSVELDLPRLSAHGIVTPESPRSRLADEFRGAKRGLLVNVRGESAGTVKRANCIMVTSSLPGEGKTFTAINLAMSLAMEVDSSVMLIDADVMRPSVLNRLGVPPSKGLLDLLTEPELTLSDVILRTNVHKLSLLPAGRASGQATELLASSGMGRLVEKLASSDPSRILLFDSPPLLAAPETRVLAAHVGQIVLVIEAQRTSRNAVTEALELIKDRPVVMTLLNKARAGAGSSYGYGNYGYGAHYGSH